MSQDNPADLRKPEDEDEEENDFPTYANEQNKELNGIIKDKRRFIKRFTDEIEDVDEKVKVLQEHFLTVQQELEHTQTLVEQKNREIETEDHLKQVAERETGRLYAELKKLESQAAEQQDRLNSIQNQIFKGNEKLDQYKLESNWNQEELEQWALASRQKEEDNLTLEKYRKADEGKIKELTLHIERLTLKVRDKQDKLEREVTETQAKQIELDKTAEEFKRKHAERSVLFRHVEKANETYAKKRQALVEAAAKHTEDRLRLRQKNSKLEERKNFLAKQILDNQQNESKIILETRRLEAERMRELQESQRIASFREDVEIEKRQVSAFASDLANLRIVVINLNKELAARRQRLEEAMKKKDQIISKLESQVMHTENLEVSAKQAEQLFKDAEFAKEVMERRITDKKNKQFKLTQELFTLREHEASLIGEISGLMASCRNLQAEINKKDQEVQRQEKLLYDVDYRIQKMERKVEVATGERVNDESKELLQKIETRKKELTEKQSEMKELSRSVRSLVDELRLIDRKVEFNAVSEANLNTQLEEVQLEIKMIEQALGKRLQDKNEVLVQHDVMKLEVKKLKDNLSSGADKLFTLENSKYQLQMSMEEREKEVAVHRDVLMAERRSVSDEKHKVVVELADRKSKVQNLKVKFENLCGKNRAKEDGEERTQAYYVIKAAQEREELQRYGDELEAKIKKSEFEIRALSNTLDHLKGRNSGFRDGFLKKTDARELEVKASLEDQCRGANENLARKRRELQVMQKHCEEDAKRLSELQTQSHLLSKQLSDLQEAKAQVASHLAEQEAKLERARKSVTANLVQVQEGSTIDIEIKLQLEQSKTRCLLSAISALATDMPEVGSLLDGPLESIGLRVPSRPASSASSRGSRS